MEPHREVLAQAARHTLEVIEAVPDAFWDRAVPGLWTLRQQLGHLALVRESILRTLAGETTEGLGATFEAEAWTRGGTTELAEAFRQHQARCEALLDRALERDLDRPFTTYFGTPSTPRNYLRMALLEETHHRAQMIQLLRLMGGTPPTHPGAVWAALGVQPPM